MNRKVKIIILGIFGSILFSCNSSVLYPAKYSSTCFYVDAPSKELYLKSKDRFVLTYPNSFEKIMGMWKIDKDSLLVISNFKGSLLDKDSIPFREEKRFIIKGKKLIDIQDKKCFLVLSHK